MIISGLKTISYSTAPFYEFIFGEVKTKYIVESCSITWSGNDFLDFLSASLQHSQIHAVSV